MYSDSHECHGTKKRQYLQSASGGKKKPAYSSSTNASISYTVSGANERPRLVSAYRYSYAQNIVRDRHATTAAGKRREASVKKREHGCSVTCSKDTKEDELHDSAQLARFVAAKLDSVLVKYPNKK